jgi:hypothetical protein
MKEMSSQQSIGNFCICHIFSQPFHINTGGSFRALTDMFSRNNNKNTEGNEMNSAMLSELGVDISSINEDIEDMSSNHLCTKKAHTHLQTNSICLINLIKENRPDTILSDTVMIYIDPAPVTGEMSYNAICFATRINHILSNSTAYKYVILAIEKFKSDMFDPDTRDYGIATARILMKDIDNIFTFYGGHFKTFVIAPEADSISMDQFWVQCQQLYANNKKFLAKNGPRVFFTTLKQSLNKSSKEQLIMDYKSYREKQGLSILDGTKVNKKRKMHDESSPTDLILTNTSIDCMKYRVGYNLGRNKTKIYLDFIFKEYNGLNVYCASEVFGYTLCSKNISIPTFIAENLDVLQLKTIGNKNRKYRISGKKQRNGEYITDDVADAVIMSIMLFKLAVGEEATSSPLYELQPIVNKSKCLHKIQDQEYIVTVAQPLLSPS